jgi:phenylalanyl-tRNA synthetase alpha chain
MLDRIEDIRKEFHGRLALANDTAALDHVRITYLSRSGLVAGLFDRLKELPNEQKPATGKLLNTLRSELQSAFDEKKTAIERQTAASASMAIDPTLPGRHRHIGTIHPITRTVEEMKAIFLRMGFGVALGPEIEDDFHNFTALNFPPDHPARDSQDTFFVAPNILLRTHTTPVQIREMLKHKPPVRIIMPGRVFRNEAITARSHAMFHQVDGLYVDTGVTFADLKGTLVHFVKQFYGNNVKYKFRPTFFPFTEPSADMYISCFICGGKGCRLCKNNGWLEILGAGMVHPHVLQNCGVDPEKYTGFAFGIGIERTTLLRYNIDDIRLFYENDLRLLRQF